RPVLGRPHRAVAPEEFERLLAQSAVVFVLGRLEDRQRVADVLLHALASLEGRHLRASERRHRGKLVEEEGAAQQTTNVLVLLHAELEAAEVLRDRAQRLAEPLVVLGVDPGDTAGVDSDVRTY